VCVEVEGRRSLVVKKLLGEALENSPNLKCLAIDANGVYEGLVLDSAALKSVEAHLSALKSPPGNNGVLQLDLSQVFTEDITSELVSRMLESLEGPERRHWILIK